MRSMKNSTLSGLPGNEIIDERDVTNMDHLIQPYFSQSHYSTYLKAITTYLWSFLSRPGSTYDLALKQLKANDARSRGELYLATWATVQDALEKTGFQQLEDWCEHRTKLRSCFNPKIMDYLRWVTAVIQTNNKVEELKPGRGWDPSKTLRILYTALARNLPSSYQSIKANEAIVVSMARMAERIRGFLHMQHAKPVEIENLDALIAWLLATSKNDKYDPLTAPSPPEEVHAKLWA